MSAFSQSGRREMGDFSFGGADQNGLQNRIYIFALKNGRRGAVFGTKVPFSIFRLAEPLLAASRA